MGDLTLVLRLAGPFQSWGETSKFLTRGTLPYPTYSGLLGLFRAALGSGRADSAYADVLDGVDVVVRVDRPGREVVDFHTIGAPSSGEVGREWTVPNGSGKGWYIGGEPCTLITTRNYLADAAFTVLITGPADKVKRLADAVRQPKWALFLGRKGCTPDYPLALAVTSTPVADLLVSVPVLAPGQVEDSLLVDVHWLTAKPSEHPELVDVVHADQPAGPHPQHGYRSRARWIARGKYEAPVVRDRDALLSWADMHTGMRSPV